MRAAPVKLTALTQEEQAFAADHHDIILKFLRYRRLSYNDYYDIIAMRYLQTVKKWFARPELHQNAFEAIAWQDMRSSVSNEYQKQEKQIKTVSLDAVMSGTDDFTLGQIVTYENLNYLRKENSTMKINYDVQIPVSAKLGRQPNVEMELILEFLAGKHTTMCLEFDTAKEAAKKAGNIRSYRKNHNRTDFEVYKLDCKIYLEKIKTKKTAQKGGAENGRA